MEIKEISGPGKATLFRKMAGVLGDVQRIPKSGTNTYFRYDYATEADLLDVLRPALAKHGVAFYVSCVGSQVISTNGAKQGDITRVQIEATFGCGETGETITVTWYGDGQDNADKGLSKAYTAAIKYLLMKTFLVSSGDDPDEGAPEARPKPAAQPQPAQPNSQAAQPGAPAKPANPKHLAEIRTRWAARWQEAVAMDLPNIDQVKAKAGGVEYIGPLPEQAEEAVFLERGKKLAEAIAFHAAKQARQAAF